MRRENSTSAPAPVKISLSRGEIAMIQREADRRNAFRNYSVRRDAWGRGFISDPAFVGLAGEYALCSYLNQNLNTELVIDSALRKKGDGGVDISVFGATIQLKTRKSSSSNLVRRVDSYKSIREMSSDFSVFASISNSDILLLGWLETALVAELGVFEKSRVSDHWNLSIEDQYLDPMCRLVKELNLWR